MDTNNSLSPLRKIIHVDMDCFYAAIEIRENPLLANQPIAVGGGASERGVLCTCNYLARQYGVRSAMPTVKAYQLCPDLVVLPVNMPLYKSVAHSIQAIFHEFTSLVEPLSLDEAYLDVSHSTLHRGSATLIAKAIRKRIAEVEKLTASAGVAPNKFLAKIASGWKKPNGLFVIAPSDVDAFVNALPVTELYGVGKVTAKKLHDKGFYTCSDLQKLSLYELVRLFGKFGKDLYDQSRGIDNREVRPNRIAKSLSVEETFSHDMTADEAVKKHFDSLYERLQFRLNRSAYDRTIKNHFVKIKWQDFSQKTREESATTINKCELEALVNTLAQEKPLPIRLLGIGVHFQENTTDTFLQPLLL